MKYFLRFLACLLPVVANAGQKPHATASWIAEKAEITADDPIRTVIRMTVDEGWHTYWENPGEGGLPLSIEAELPAGWSIGKIQYPVPKRFMTGELPGFGYEGGTLFPVTLTAPAGFRGNLPPLKASLSWLTCNDETCVPGEAELTFPTETDPGAVTAAYEKLPRALANSMLSVSRDGDNIFISLTLADNSACNPESCELFPITHNVIDPATEPRFKKSTDPENTWQASAPKSEYLSGKIGKFEILLVAPNGTASIATTD